MGPLKFLMLLENFNFLALQVASKPNELKSLVSVVMNLMFSVLIYY